jgi:subtilisin family serine protease
MAAAQRMQNIKKVTAAVISMLLIVLATSVSGAGQVALAGASERTEVASGEVDGIIIGWEDGGNSLNRLTSLASENPSLNATLDDLPGGVESLEEGQWLAPGIQAVDLPEGTPLDQALEDFSSLPGVCYVEPDATISVDASSMDQNYSSQWFISRISVEKVWEVEKGSGDMAVAVLDTGVDGFHPDLTGRVLKGYNFVSEDGNTLDIYGHGTHVAGIVAASGENGSGIAGLAWRVKILPVKILGDNGCGNYSDLIAGIRYAADNGASVINMSPKGFCWWRPPGMTP